MPVVSLLAANPSDEWEMIELQGELMNDLGLLQGLHIGELTIGEKVRTNATRYAITD